MYVCLSVDPIAYNRISTWKTGILRARACRILHDRIYLRGKYCAAHLRAPSIWLAYELTAQAAWILLAQSTSAVPQSTQAECARCYRDKYALKCTPLLICHLNCMVVYRHVHENVRYLERINVFPLASAHTPIHSEGTSVRVCAD